MTNTSLFSFFTHAGPVVKIVMLILLSASVLSWTLIFQKRSLLKQVQRMVNLFEEKFWSGTDLNRLYTSMMSRDSELSS